MHEHLAQLQPTIPGTRRIVVAGGLLPSSTSIRLATQKLPAFTILRTVYFAGDGDLFATRNLTLNLASGDTIAPADTDFLGSGSILPNASLIATTADYPADPLNSARDVTYNFLLPDREHRILIRVNNQTTLEIAYRIRLLIDGLFPDRN